MKHLSSQQDIAELEGLDECVNLEKLSVVENRIRQIKGLDKLKNLKELYLYSNMITKIEGLQALSNLEVMRGAHALEHGA